MLNRQLIENGVLLAVQSQAGARARVAVLLRTVSPAAHLQAAAACAALLPVSHCMPCML